MPICLFVDYYLLVIKQKIQKILLSQTIIMVY